MNANLTSNFCRTSSNHNNAPSKTDTKENHNKDLLIVALVALSFVAAALLLTSAAVLAAGAIAPFAACAIAGAALLPFIAIAACKILG